MSGESGTLFNSPGDGNIFAKANIKGMGFWSGSFDGKSGLRLPSQNKLISIFSKLLFLCYESTPCILGRSISYDSVFYGNRRCDWILGIRYLFHLLSCFDFSVLADKYTFMTLLSHLQK